MIRRLAAALLAAACLAPLAAANDGFGGISATGLQFSKTEDVRMKSEDLFLSKDKIRVAYEFENVSGADVTGEVIFPLPPVSVGALMNSDFNLPDDPDKRNYVNFKAVVDGVPVDIKVDRIAVRDPEYVESEVYKEPEPREAYDSPGEDVTAILEGAGMPLSLRFETLQAAFKTLTPAQKKALVDAKLLEIYPADPANQIEEGFYPRWSIIERYHWTQTFPAGKTVSVKHEYDARPPGGLFSWQHPIPPDFDYMHEFQKRYCIDEGTSKAMVKALTYKDPDGNEQVMGVAYYLDYVLTTANTWAGPIGSFKMTIDKGDPKNVVSFCADGVKKTGPTTFVVEAKDFSPKSDIRILIAGPMNAE